MGWYLNFPEDENRQYWTRTCDVCGDDSDELHEYNGQVVCYDCFINSVKDGEWYSLPIGSKDWCDRCDTTPINTRIVKGLCTCHECAKDVWHNEWCELPIVHHTFSKTDPYTE